MTIKDYPRCRTCKYFQGPCSHPEMGTGSKGQGAYGIEIVELSEVTIDSEPSDIYTDSDFGCIHHEAKD